MTALSGIRTGTGSSMDGEKYRWATMGHYKVKHWPLAGGSQAEVWVDGPGWVLDADDEMPHEVWIELLRAVDAPLDRIECRHKWGQPEQSRLAGTWHRKCQVPGCRSITLDLDEV